MRFFFHIGYNGYNYRGWQFQPGIASVQHVLESTLSQVLKTPVSIMGCGRTDAMVHASQFFFHLDVNAVWDYDLLFRLNKNLPDDIAIFDIIPVDENQHARYDALKRTYDYFIHTYKDPFLSQLSSLYLGRDLDLGEMKRAVALLTKYDDYRAFCKTPAEYDHTICHVSEATLFTDSRGDLIRFQISANRFLGRMIRIIVGRLLEIGNRNLSVDAFEQYLITRVTPPIIEPAYPQGLYLSKVTYPFLDMPQRTNFIDTVLEKTVKWTAL
ncbi:MAG: tRNA pseudouridine(38-40) synthase TruA [Chryseolinea sp.]